MKFQDDISNMNTHTHTHTYVHTDKQKPICPPLFQSWGHKNSQVATMPQLAAAAKRHACCLFAAIHCEKPFISLRDVTGGSKST